MNKIVISAAVAAVAGLTGGFAAGYFWCKKRIFEKYTVVEEEIEPLVVETIGGPEAEQKKEEESKESEEDSKDPFQGLDIPVIKTKEDTENLYKRAFVDYARLGRDPRINDVSDADREDFREPYLITEDEFNQGKRHFDKIFINYFEDGVYVDESTDEPDPSLERCLGVRVPEAFGYGTDDPDMVYIRNERLNIDYCVVNQHRTYQEYSGS